MRAGQNKVAPMTVQGKRQLGARIRQLRLERHLSQERFANMVEMDRGYICGIERGKKNPSFEKLERIAAGLDVSLSTLLWGVGTSYSEADYEYTRIDWPLPKQD